MLHFLRFCESPRQPRYIPPDYPRTQSGGRGPTNTSRGAHAEVRAFSIKRTQVTVRGERGGRWSEHEDEVNGNNNIQVNVTEDNSINNDKSQRMAQDGSAKMQKNRYTEVGGM